MRIGISEGAYTHPLGLRPGAKKMREHGYQCLDYQGFVNTETDSFMACESVFEKRLQSEKNTLNEEGITVSQVHGPWRSPIRDATEEDRKERFESMSKAIRGAAYLSSPICVIHPIMPFGAHSAESADFVRELNCDYFSRLADVAKEYGVIIGYENMPFKNFPIATTDEILSVIKSVNHSNFKMCLDTGHAIVRSEPLYDVVHKIGKEYLVALHVHDNDGVGDLHNIPGEGIGDFWGFARALKEIAFEGVFSYETGVSADCPITELEARQIALLELAKKYVG